MSMNTQYIHVLMKDQSSRKRTVYFDRLSIDMISVCITMWLKSGQLHNYVVIVSRGGAEGDFDWFMLAAPMITNLQMHIQFTVLVGYGLLKVRKVVEISHWLNSIIRNSEGYH